MVFCQPIKTDIIDQIAGPNKKRAPVLAQQLKVIRMGLVAKERLNII